MTAVHGSLPEGARFDGYVIIRRLGAGGMGVVYQATHVELNKHVALKALHGELADSPEAVSRFMREARTASSIRHPNIVDITDVGMVGSTPYLVMELLEGHNLAALLARKGRLGYEEAIDLLLPLTHGLTETHARGIVHRDLKPANIFLSRSGDGRIVPKILDFGICRVLDDSGAAHLTDSTTAIGTPAYMSPEQARGHRELDGRSDQYALGVILYQCLTGSNPFSVEGHSLLRVIHAITTGDFASPEHLCPELPEELEMAVLRAMALDPADRFASVADFGRALLPFASDHMRAHWETVLGAAPNDLTAFGIQLEPSSIPTLSSLRVEVGSQHEGAHPTTKLSITKQADVPKRKDGVGPVMLLAALVAVIAGVLWVEGRARQTQAMPFAISSSTRLTPVLSSIAPSKKAAPEPPSEGETYVVSLTVDPPHATILIDGLRVGKGRLSATLVRGQSHLLRIEAKGYTPHVLELRRPPVPRVIKLQPAPATPRVARKSKAEPSAKQPAPRPSSSPTKTDNINPWAK